MPAALPWILSCAAFCLLGGAASILALRRRREPPAASPSGAFAVTPVLDARQRRVHDELRAALPDCVILARLPLARFCHPVDAGRAQPHLQRIAALDVDFALCSASGRVLAAIDIERDGDPAATQARRWKAQLFAATPVRYLRCAAEAMPSADELRQLVGAAAPRPTASQRPRAPQRHRDAHLWLDPVRTRPATSSDDAQQSPPWVKPRRRDPDRRHAHPSAAHRH